LLFEAIRIYRDNFEPSAFLKDPYVMAGVPLVAADTDEQAQYLATSPAQRHLKLIRGEPIFVPPPVDTMDGRWSEAERNMVESRLSVAVVGGPETVRHKLIDFLDNTQADELIFTSDLYDHAQRLRSFEIAAEAMTLINSPLPELQRL
jgi:alkanesulfonate monooxygenase SsuD/methylene tetrahydromethanopterin reductase-like flavin-dependent oxidoreductase (luciferase family)